VGRHNALDKVVGHLALHGDLPARDTIVAVSGRLSYEIVQKSAVAGISVLCAVSAPSSLAVDAARRVDQTLVGFLRGDRFNVYTGSERVDLDR
jgi:FdhD protein